MSDKVDQATMRCPRCLQVGCFVSISLNGGITRLAQCVPCGKIHPDVYGYGSASGRWDDGWTRR